MCQRIVFVLVVLLCAGCGSTISEETGAVVDEPASTNTPVPTPTFTVEEGTPITSAEDLSGIWFSLKATNYSLFREDGFYAASPQREGLSTGNAFQGQYWFEDGILYIQYENIEDENGESQPVAVNSYTVVEYPDQTIRFFEVEAEHERLSYWLAGDTGVAVYFHRVD